MKKRGKTGKKSKPLSKRKDSLSSEDEHVSVLSSLPPSVEGQIRCFLTVSVSKFIWAVKDHPEDVTIRIRWWGEQGQGALLQPLQKRQEKLGVRTRWKSVRYPVCSGPKQFAAYLNDMGSLLLETVHTSTHIPFAKALISEITQLTASHPVDVIVPVMSVISPFNKVADIQVFIKFESVSAAYNKLPSTIPTVDTGLDKESVDISNPHPTPPPYLNPATPVAHPKHQREVKDPFESPAPVKGVKFSEDPPERLEYPLDPSLLSLLENEMSQHSATSSHLFDSELDKRNDCQFSAQIDNVPTSHESGQGLGSSNMDWIGTLLEKGQRLREGLAMSTLLDDNNLSGYMDGQHSPPERHVLPGCLFKEILSSKQTSRHYIQPDVLQQTLDNEQVNEDDNTVVDLLMGDLHHRNDLIEQLSNMSDISEDLSEIGDPLHDDSLLMDLFYKSLGDKSDGSDTENTVSTDEEHDRNQRNFSMEHDDKNLKEIKVKQFKKKKKKNEKTKKVNEREDVSDEENLDHLEDEENLDHLDSQKKIEAQEKSFNRDLTAVDTSSHSSDIVHNLGADTLTALGRINTARVLVEKLQLIDTCASEQQNASKKPSTFFVEYHFPMTTIKDTTGGVSVAKELTRVVSKKIHNGAVVFSHRSVFPVCFNASVLDHWWVFAMSFRVFKRDLGQRKPVEFGVGIFPLKTVLLSSNLNHTALIEVKEHDNELRTLTLPWQQSDSDSLHSAVVGKLEVKVELELNGKQLPCQASTASSTPGSVFQQQVQTNAPIVSKPIVTSGTTHALSSNSHRMDIVTSKPPLPKGYPLRELKELENPADTLTLHSLLWIPEGKGITLESHGTYGRTGNLFLTSRTFWCEEVSKSPINWATNNPQFGFKQIAPVLLTPTLLQRTCNNFMVIEVWDKVIPQGEKLVGIVKLPLHQLYLSYRDPKITETLIKSKFPVVCVDDLFTVNNPFTSHSHGQLKVLLAMGTQQQILCLLEVKGIGQAPSGLRNRELHHLDRQRETSQNETKQSTARNFSIVDHQFEITVEDVRGLSIFKSTVWGETDCYIQYQFPSPIQNTDDPDNEVVPGLKSYHTSTTLCVPDPSFNDVNRHSFLLPSGVPVQRYLLAAYSGSWTSVSSIPGTGGVPFELWRRYYYPNARDQLVAKASLPVAKLCAMVTMKKHREPSKQTFSLPLVVLPEEDKVNKQFNNSGLLDVSIKYQANKIQTTDDKPNLGGDQVCLSVDVIRVCGLKEAAKLHAHTNPSMSYPAEIGVNAYVVIKLPLGRKKMYVTRTVARTFAPEFSHHIEIMSPLQMSKTSHGSNEHHQQEQLISLAEKLEMSEAMFEIWHQDARGFGNIGSLENHSKTKSSMINILLGVVSVPLTQLLAHRTGIRGWHTIKPDEKLVIGTHHSNNVVLGGLQLSIKFEESDDRERVVHVGRSLGWSPPPGVEYDEDEDDDEDDAQTPKGLELSVKISRAWVPREFIKDLKQGYMNQSNLEIKGYVRYKLYDKRPVCSRVVHVRAIEKDMFLLDVKHSKCSVMPATSSLKWYLREENLEVQVWLRGEAKQDKGSVTLPDKKDKLIGSAFINLSTFVSKGLCQSQSSGTFPLFKAGADAIDGASVNVQITLAKPTSSSHSSDRRHQHDGLMDDGISSEGYPSTKGFNDDESESLKSSTDPTSQGQRNLLSENQFKAKLSGDDDTFAAHIIVQEARHLSTVAGPNGERVSPNAYVTYQMALTLPNASTSVCLPSTSPVWEYQKLERLPLFSLKEQNIIFRVWHEPQNNGDVTGFENRSHGSSKTSNDPLPLGFASVDLSPLAAGLRQLIGWYNIMDFNGECKGQIKLGVVPLTPVSPSRCLPKSRISSHLSSISKLRLVHLNSQEQQEKAPAIDLSQKQTLLDSLQRLGSISVSENREETDTTEPVATSSSLLFKQLRNNMRELDDLQRGLQAKICKDSSVAMYYSKENFSYIPMKHHTQQNIDENKSSNITVTESDREDLLSFEKNQASDIVSVPDNVKWGEMSDSPINKSIDFKDNNGKKATTDHLLHSKTFENDLKSIQNTLKQEDQTSDNATCSPATEDSNRSLDDSIEGNLSDLVQNSNSSQNINIHRSISRDKDNLMNTWSSVSDLEECVSDVLEDSEAETQLPLSQKFTQERDSWLSSNEEDETKKSPLNSSTYCLTSRDQCTDEQIPCFKVQTSMNCNNPTEKTLFDDFKDKVHNEVIEITDKEPLTSCLVEDNHDYFQNEALGVTGEALLTKNGQTPVHDTHSTSPNAHYTAKLSHLHNFFMPKHELEHSMRALRLGTSKGYLHNTPVLDKQPQSKLLQRTFMNEDLWSDGYNSNAGTDQILSQFSQKEAVYKAKQAKQPPLSSAEINRIAKIFSSKTS